MNETTKDAVLIREAARGAIDVALVLGSGLTAAIGEAFERTTIPYERLQSLAFSPLPGHRGEALVGTWYGKRVLALSGRAHLYQGFAAEQVTAGVRLAHAAGARTILLTNAAGALNPKYDAGDIMLVEDHINLTGTNPLLGNEETAFVDMLDAYSPRLRSAVRKHAKKRHRLREGIYVGLLGPSYETAAEARYLRGIGGDAVGMSTVLETIAARALGMDVLAFSLITNAAGAQTTHEEVTSIANESAPLLAELIEKTLPEL